jgi:hypothetical protein
MKKIDEVQNSEIESKCCNFRYDFDYRNITTFWALSVMAPT